MVEGEGKEKGEGVEDRVTDQRGEGKPKCDRQANIKSYVLA